MQFQAICTKWHKKLTISITAENINEARNMLHKQWYSIIEIHEITDTSSIQEWNFFYFDMMSNWVLQTWKIQSDDIFKAYRKLIEDLKYNVVYIYNFPEMPEDQKNIITIKVKNAYNSYLESIGKKVEVKTKKEDEKNNELEGFSPQLLKELEKYKKFADDALVEIQNLIIKNHEIISQEQKYALEQMELELTQIRWSRNVGRMHTVIEEVMKKKWTIEVELLKKSTIKEKEKFLEETNRILKWIGSNEKIETEEAKKESVEYKVKTFFNQFLHWKTEKKESREDKKIDTQSFIYFKNKRELDIYKKALEDNDVAIVKSLFSFQFKQVKKFFLKRKLLSQNIQIIENRIQNKNISYTKIVHGIDYYFNLFFSFISTIASFFVFVLFVYGLFFISIQTLSSFNVLNVSVNSSSILFLVILSIFTTITLFIRGWITLFIGLIVFLYISWFLIVNF